MNSCTSPAEARHGSSDSNTTHLGLEPDAQARELCVPFPCLRVGLQTIRKSSQRTHLYLGTPQCTISVQNYTYPTIVKLSKKLDPLPVRFFLTAQPTRQNMRKSVKPTSLQVYEKTFPLVPFGELVRSQNEIKTTWSMLHHALNTSIHLRELCASVVNPNRIVG
jgi:hypothetical protein